MTHDFIKVLAFPKNRIKERNSTLEESLSLTKSTLASAKNVFVEMFRFSKPAIEHQKFNIIFQFITQQLSMPNIGASLIERYF